MKDMRIDPIAFKPYDIRGTVPDQIDEGGAEQVARAFAVEVNSSTVIVGRDVRLTGQAFRDAVVHGLVHSGVDVIDIGICSTDEFYFACGRKGLPGLMITASHNPKEFNGFKMVRELPVFVLSHQILGAVTNQTFEDAPKRGDISDWDVTDAFLDRMLEIIPVESIKPLKVVVDTSNGSQGAVWQKLVKRLPIELIPQFFEPDGNFPNHGNDVVQLENQAPLRDRVKKEKADLGLIFDPDGDRCLLVDDRGTTVPGDFITALLAVSMLKKQPGSTIVYDVRASDAVPDMVCEAGGKPFAWKIGHAFIKPKMQEFDAVFGGEISGHFYFKDFWFADNGLLTGLTILQYVSSLAGKLSDQLRLLEARYHLSGEINSSVKDRAETVAKVKEAYADGEIDELDGVAVRYPDWRFVVRPSANEELIRLTLEAQTRELMESKRDEVLALIRR